nr:hypothetical protein [Tanacetum cinerariifolium]
QGPNPAVTQGEPQPAKPLVESQGEQPADLNIVNKELAPTASDAKPNEGKELVVHNSEENKSKRIISVEDDSDEDNKQPLSKIFEIMTLILDIPNPTPLNTFVPEYLLKPKEQQKSIQEFTDQLFKTTSSRFSPTPPRELTPSRNSSKGKAVAIIEEPGNELVKYQEKGEKEATMKITRGDNPLNLVVHPNFRLKTLGFSEWLEAKRLGLPLPPELATFGLTTEEKKRKRTEFIKEVFVIENVRVNGIDRNLIPPPGIMPIQGVVINKPESRIFFMNGNTDIGFQRESEFHLTHIVVIELSFSHQSTRNQKKEKE